MTQELLEMLLKRLDRLEDQVALLSRQVSDSTCPKAGDCLSKVMYEEADPKTR